MSTRSLAAALLLASAPSLFASQALSPPARLGPSTSAVQFANLWRAAEIEIDQVRCSSPACASALSSLRAVGPAFEAGGDASALLPKLRSALQALDLVLARDLGADWSRGYAGGQRAVAVARSYVTLHPGSVMPEVGTYDQCTSDCQAAFAVGLATCAFWGPAAPGCVAGAIIALAACYAYCAEVSQSGDNGGGGGGDGYCAGHPDDPSCPSCGDHDCGDLLPPGVKLTPPAIQSAVARLALRLTPAEMRTAENVLTAVAAAAH